MAISKREGITLENDNKTTPIPLHVRSIRVLAEVNNEAHILTAHNNQQKRNRRENVGKRATEQ